MIKKKDADLSISNMSCFVCKEAIKDNRYVFVISYCEPQDYKAIYNALRICPSCWELSAGEDWMFEK